MRRNENININKEMTKIDMTKKPLKSYQKGRLSFSLKSINWNYSLLLFENQGIGKWQTNLRNFIEHKM